MAALIAQHRVCIAALAALALAGCNTLFDAPAGAAGGDALSPQTISDLQAIAQGQALEAMGSVPNSDSLNAMAQGAAQGAVQTGVDLGAKVAASLSSAKVQRLSPAQAREPAIYFEKISSPMPQLVVLSAGTAAVRWNDKPLLMPEGNSSHVILVPAGKHTLTIEYADAQPFKAEVAVARYERLTLRVDAPASKSSEKKQ
ncbi:hypothetical protein E8K88_16135 [Lampropedia aestuarii]|uniref:PEGA domain-containing protein n=1 Tax=Lampropedia aestuarii TaxID=2562762 RepID=A0A4S5BJG8_9BURK|nr:hypothetical protein [Lampropedia aestuarii]THJ31063.1 hypothetical protein E8K88_16135 [Lampropedia aestuarii]